MPLQQFLLVRQHVLALMTSEGYAGTLPVVPSASLAASAAAQIYLLRRPALPPRLTWHSATEAPALPHAAGSSPPSP